ncbi:MAG: phosphotransferase [Metamycoplasmataceae bacterium]
MKKIYQGKHNITFLFEKDKKLYTLRKPLNNIVNHKNEIIFLNTLKDTITINETEYIKNYYPGTNLKKNNLSSLSKIKKELDKVWKTNISLPINNNVLLKNNINDEKYKILIEKYSNNNDLVLCHGDLRQKNILFLNNNKKIKLIDFEWIHKNDKYFDLAHLHLYCFFSLKNIIKIFKVKKEKLIDFIYIVKTFNNWFEKEKY